MKKILKVLSSLLIIPLLFSMIPYIALAMEGVCGEKLVWNFNSNTGTLTISGEGAMTDTPWQDFSEDIKKVVINQGITSIDDEAFLGCYKLKEVNLADSIKTIGIRAFQQCYELESIVIPEGVITVENSVFSYCEKLTSIEIPSTVTEFNDSFYQCGSLQRIIVNENNGYYSNDEYGVLFNKDKTQLIRYPINNVASSYNIPNSVKHISENAFMNCANLTNVIIPETVTIIDDFAFAYSGLNEVEISSVKTISPYAFFFCFNLERVIISDGVIKIGERAFELCQNLEFVHIPPSVTTISNDAFASSSTYICSDTDECYAKTYADDKGIKFVLCKGEHTETDLPDVPGTPVTPPVETKTLSRISVRTLPRKIEYFVGEQLDVSGLEIEATYSDGTTGLITDYISTGFNSSNPGICIVVVSYSENGITQTCEFSITVNEVEEEETPIDDNDKTVLSSILEFFKGILGFIAMALKFLLNLFESLA